MFPSSFTTITYPLFSAHYIWLRFAESHVFASPPPQAAHSSESRRSLAKTEACEGGLAFVALAVQAFTCQRTGSTIPILSHCVQKNYHFPIQERNPFPSVAVPREREGQRKRSPLSRCGKHCFWQPTARKLRPELGRKKMRARDTERPGRIPPVESPQIATRASILSDIKDRKET